MKQRASGVIGCPVLFFRYVTYLFGAQFGKFGDQFLSFLYLLFVKNLFQLIQGILCISIKVRNILFLLFFISDGNRPF